jgi:hypothetical protein
MERRLGLASAAVAAITVTVASLALAAAQPGSPPAGASTSSHPTFAWTLPANEEADILQIASNPSTTPSGEFFRENVVATGFLDANHQSSWTPASALFAGPHWWNVQSHNSDTFVTSYSTASPFTVAPETRLRQVRIRRMSWTFSPDTLDFTVRWVTNVRNVVVEARIFRGSRQVGRVRDTNETIISMDADTGFLTWRRPRRVKTGSRLRVLVSVRGGGRAATVRRFVRAP